VKSSARATQNPFFRYANVKNINQKARKMFTSNKKNIAARKKNILTAK
jgi:hypothetical protein